MATPRATIPDLPEQTAVVDSDLLVVQNGATTKKMTVGKLTVASTSAVDAHIADTTGAHAASAISAAPGAAPFTGTDVQSQLGQAAAGLAAVQATSTTTQNDLTAHLADAVDAHDGSAVSLVAGAAPFTQTNVQAFATQTATSVNAATAQSTANASNLTAHLNDTTDVHAASAITVLPAGNLNSTNAQAALAELQVDIDTIRNTTFTSSANGLAPASGGGSVNYLRADGSWSVPAGGGGSGITDGDKGDITVSALGATWMFDTSVVTAAAKTVLDDMTTTAMRTTLGLGNVDNTTDAAKPVSTAQQTALDAKANAATTITPTAPLTGGGSLAANRTLDISVFTASVKGAVPPPTTATGKFLKDDGTWATVSAGSTAQTIEAVAGTTYTVVAGDANKIKSMSGTATVTLPSAGPATGERVDFVCVGGPATFALGGGATWAVAPTPSAVARAVGSFVTAIKMGATTWALTGDLA